MNGGSLPIRGKKVNIKGINESLPGVVAYRKMIGGGGFQRGLQLTNSSDLKFKCLCSKVSWRPDKKPEKA